MLWFLDSFISVRTRSLWPLNRQAMTGLLAIGEALDSVMSTSHGYEVRSRVSKTCRLRSWNGYQGVFAIGAYQLLKDRV